VDFQFSAEQNSLQNLCRELAADFATRSAAHDRDASHPAWLSSFTLSVTELPGRPGDRQATDTACPAAS
jgi:hypothetical protein